MKLTATPRDLTGPRASRLRRQGRLPAVMYGHHAKTAAISMDTVEFQRVFARTGRSQLIDLEVDGGKTHKVLVKEVQLHPRWPGPIHVDLFEVSLREKVHVEVPLVFLGESPAVKRGEGDLLQNLHSLAVECLPNDIPESFQVDVSGLEELDMGIRAGELPMPGGVALLADPDELVVKVQPRRAIVEPEVEEAEEAPEAAAAEGEQPEPEAAGESSEQA